MGIKDTLDLIEQYLGKKDYQYCANMAEALAEDLQELADAKAKRSHMWKYNYAQSYAEAETELANLERQQGLRS